MALAKVSLLVLIVSLILCSFLYAELKVIKIIHDNKSLGIVLNNDIKVSNIL